MSLRQDLSQQLINWIGASELKCSLRVTNLSLWESIWQSLDYQANAYSVDMIDYQHAYYIGAGWELVDASLILLNDGKPCGLLPLTYKAGLEPSLTSLGSPILAPIFLPNITKRTIKKICAGLLSFFYTAHLDLAIKHMLLEQAPNLALGYVGGGLSEWHQLQMSTGASVSLQHDLYVDLLMPIDQIWASFRKSYRPLINSGTKIWQIYIMNTSSLNQAKWTEFRLLHQEVAGRVTRSIESWNKQFQMIVNSKAFFVYLQDPSSHRMVGGGFFQYTKHECLYAVGAYDRTIFDKPLGHVVQYIAINEMRKLALSWYKIGRRFYKQDSPIPTSKELAISEFKQGFSTHSFIKYTYTNYL